ncbi:GntR family transcriptional regulator [Eubacterium aggregans]|uniref:GntR family transcriptional regulator n=1 Tax=Eubacterium aggregans TaxID=81409 RepID=UPI003F2DE427
MDLYTINKQIEEPLYVQLMRILKERIETYMNEGEQLSSERDICEEYKVSRTTVRQALDLLEKEGYLEKIQGKGNFVTSPLINQDLVKFYSFTEEMRKLGKTPSYVMPSFELVEVTERAARRLELNVGDLAYRIVRIRKADDIPMMYETTYLPCDRFENLKPEYFKEYSMYDLFAQVYGVRISNAEEILYPIIINRLESINLEFPEGGPGLKIQRITREGNKVIEYTESIARGDKFKYRVYLENESR